MNAFIQALIFLNDFRCLLNQVWWGKSRATDRGIGPLALLGTGLVHEVVVEGEVAPGPGHHPLLLWHEEWRAEKYATIPMVFAPMLPFFEKEM